MHPLRARLVCVCFLLLLGPSPPVQATEAEDEALSGPEIDHEAPAPEAEGPPPAPLPPTRERGAGKKGLADVSSRRCDIVDNTGIAPKSKRRRERQRDGIHGVVLHATGFRRNDDPKRYRKVTAHYVVLPDGSVAQNHPLTSVLMASHGFNSNTVAIEFAGNFPGNKGRCWKPAKFGCHEVTRAQIAAGRCLVRRLTESLPAFFYVYAHRQSARSRGNDPGPDVWFEVGEWAQQELGLGEGGDDYKIGSGRSIDSRWRSRRDGRPDSALCDPLDPACGPGEGCFADGDGFACKRGG